MNALRAAGLAALFLAGCGGGGSPPPSALVWARSDDSATLDPAETEWGEDLKVVASLYETLVAIDGETLQPAPRLATSWTLAPDGRSASFELRGGVRFHDGTPLTAEAVAFSFARMLDPAHPQRPRIAPYARNFSAIGEVRAEGDLRVAFAFKSPFRLTLQALALPAASIVSPAAARKHGADFARNPSGTGPYRLGRWERDVKMELERFDAYWGEKPAVARVLVVPVASPATAIEKLRKGEVHVVDHPAPADLARLGGDPAAGPVLQAPLTVCCLGFNMKRAPYDDARFRRAVALAIDRRALNEFAYHGRAQPAWNVVPPALWGTPPAETAPSLEKARELLAELRLVTREVELIHVNIPRPYMPEPQRVAEFLKDALRKIGLEVKVTGYDKGAYGQKTRDPSHPMFLLGWKGDYPDPDNYLYPLLHGDNAGDQNGSFFDDPEFNAAVRSAQAEFDPALRRALYEKALARYLELVPTVPLVHLGQALAVSRRASYRPHPFEYRFYQARLSQ